MAKLTKVVVDGRELALPSDGLDGRMILASAGGDPDHRDMLIRVDGGIARLFAPGDAVSDEGETPIFRLHRNGVLRYLKVDGHNWEWGAPGISEHDVREIAKVADDQGLFLVNGGGETLSRGGLLDLTTDWVPHVVSRRAAPERATVPVVVNGAPRQLVSQNVSFEDLVGLAFPERTDLAQRMFTVTYRHGPADKPEGSLVPTQAVRISPGATFNVTATDKS